MDILIFSLNVRLFILNLRAELKIFGWEMISGLQFPAQNRASHLTNESNRYCIPRYIFEHNFSLK